METAIVSYEAQSLEFIHEKIDPGTRCPDHPRQHLLRYFGKHFFRVVSLAVPSEQKKSARQSFLARVKELIDQILLNSYVPRKHLPHEVVRFPTLSVDK